MMRLLWLLPMLLFPLLAASAPGVDAFTATPTDDGGQTYTLSLQVLLFMTALSLLPAALLLMTSFTRIVIVLAILRQALGTQNTPSNQILVGLALFLTAFVMMPVFQESYLVGVKPYLEEQVNFTTALENAAKPVRDFMFAQTRESDLALFAELSRNEEIASRADVPFSMLLPAFATSELKTGFQIGFLIFIPFLIIDLVVASILMSMGMMMLSPLIISLPFKIMLFVLIDGWSLVFGTLASSFLV
ncbi:MAG: flagellar type III secretion system pore protein FliP [Gammaproteobacteria bacterium]|nr:flagellar type III secretion system pore protein FliP [Gammaproteobacteria bacterium]